ncbi:SDR family NAD(P)-dependent oxidoreductase [Sphingomonas hylomeconis]|uniref:SDR family NAD(P)-dependent oxidoreductase n=1 Tax=Sphingomonas hylomeconis TaxID=1395958 RepID=A0ABV7SUK0_9SPHN|nr:SDR family NAD(P)-dependent oxidoreductase [Sphingomonas hylomeconis]
MKLGPDIAAIVTGGASGLGYATATALRDAGVKVALFDKNAELGLEGAAAIGATFCAVDVMDHASVEAGFATARAANGQERILVNCAGGGFGAFKTAGRDKQTREIAAYPVDRFELTVQLNLIGTFRCIALSTAGMLTLAPLDGERGAIVNTASAAAEDGQMGQVAYAAAKAGIVGMTLPIARDLMGEGIRVNTILPGIFDTPLMNRARPQVKEALAASVPFPKRMGHAEEYARLALEMITNGYFNGEDVRLDGAIRMAPR